VRRTLLHSHNDEALEQARIRHGFQVLFLRFGRVAVEAFIAKPLQARERLLKERNAEIKTLEAFYQGEDKNKRDGGLTHYLRYGVWTIIKTEPVLIKAGRSAVKTIANELNPENPASPTTTTRRTKNTTQELVSQLAGDIIMSNTGEDIEKLPEPANFEQVVEEINGDLSALQDYLKNSVFYAAGFITYCHQELERIRNRFKETEDNDRQWIGIIRTAIKYERNPHIPYSIAHTKRDFRIRRELALEIKEIRESYLNVH
jgi:hypothetical protein